MRLRKGTVVVASTLALLVAGCGSGEEAGADESNVTVKLEEQNGSAESGAATLTKVGEQTRVVLEVQSKSAQGGSPVAVPQPAHIHTGSCEDLNPTPEYALPDVRGGKSETTVDVSLDELRDGAFAINVHKSAAALETYVACGNIGEGKDGDEGDSGYGY